MDKKILIVDDAAFMRSYIKKILGQNGWDNVIEASDGEAARLKYISERPDLVLMDITMPNKSGIDSLREIRDFDPDAKVIMCSAMGQELMVADAIRLGALEFIVKPFKPERLIETVRRALS